MVGFIGKGNGRFVYDEVSLRTVKLSIFKKQSRYTLLLWGGIS